MKVAASSLSIELQMSAPSGIGHGSILSRDWAVGCGLDKQERFGWGRSRRLRPEWCSCWPVGAAVRPQGVVLLEQMDGLDCHCALWSVKKNSGEP